MLVGGCFVSISGFVLNLIEEITDHIKTHKVRDEVACKDPWCLVYVPDYLMTQELCEDVVEEEPNLLEFLPNYLKTK